MDTNQDIRWLQRYDNFHRANLRILEITESSDRTPDNLSELEMEGLIQRFEYTFELGWKTLQDLLKYKGYEFMQGPNGTLRKAFEDGLISDHDGWRRMAQARVTTSHTYNEGDALAITRQIFEEYSHLLKRLDIKLNEDIIESLHSIAKVLPADTTVLPGHGEHTTIGYEVKFNPYLKTGSLR